ncbi:MAG: Fe-S cluster assembly protein SufD [Bacteroidetes bacterium]|nr:Fe-S cluster assembly protein SufD [Bacteroidota bacterium]MDA1269290.1 Fe-S cluster assembly protein SufD [Bacteroidota bacterium]
MSTLTQHELILGLFEAAPTTFLSLRQLGKESFYAQGLPTLKSEEYKFTPLAKKLESNLTEFYPAEQVEISHKQVKSALFPNFKGVVLVFSNGHYLPQLSSTSEGLAVNLLSERENTPLGSIAKIDKDPFVALNQATFTDGLHLSLDKKKALESPILLLQFHQTQGGQVISPRIWIEAGDFSKATIIDYHISLDEAPYFVNKVVEIRGGVHADITYHSIQQENNQVIEVSNLVTDIHPDAQFTSTQITLSGDMIRNNLTLNLLGSNSVGEMFGLYLLHGKTHVDNHTNVDHMVSHAESNELYKGILADQSRGVFNGKIFVRQIAQKTNAFQQNNNILLSDDVIINTKPQLEIWADDVKCSHGCTVGQLDEEALFYLQTRGIDKITAKGLLLYAFAGEVLDKIEEDSLRNYIVNQIQKRLESNF